FCPGTHKHSSLTAVVSVYNRYLHAPDLRFVHVDAGRFLSIFFSNHTATTEIYTLSLHDALPISSDPRTAREPPARARGWTRAPRSEEHTSELQSRFDLVCRLLLEKKKQSFASSLRNDLKACWPRRRQRHLPVLEDRPSLVNP